MTWWSFLQIPTIYLKLVVLFGAFQMTTHIWLSIVKNGGTLKRINGATKQKAWQLIASIESRWYGQTHASFALHWVTASVVTTNPRRELSPMVISGKFLWGSSSAVSLGPGSAVGEKVQKKEWNSKIILKKKSERSKPSGGLGKGKGYSSARFLFSFFSPQMRQMVQGLSSGKFLWGSRSAVSLAPGSAVGEKGQKRGETAKDKNNN